MLTKKVKKRISFVSLFLITTFIGIFFILKSLNNNILFFKSPTDIKLANDSTSIKKKIRIGGMVKKNSLKISEEEIKFIITDFKNEIIVSYSGTVPNLFIEGKGAVAEGQLIDKNFFIADRILAKHDENYMPPELKDIMKKNAK
jgi:cytochrome c-type biogenesis protein CcmE